jgi:hypothetical protein
MRQASVTLAATTKYRFRMHGKQLLWPVWFAERFDGKYLARANYKNLGDRNNFITSMTPKSPARSKGPRAKSQILTE